MECLIGMIENAMQFFNTYAFAQVAIYGYDFKTASKKTWNLFKETFVMLLVNFDLSHMVIALGIMMGGIVSGMAGGMWAFVFANNVYPAFALVSFVVHLFFSLYVFVAHLLFFR